MRITNKINPENRKCPSCDEIWNGKVLFLRCSRSRFKSIKWQLISIFDFQEVTNDELTKFALLKRSVFGNLLFKKNTELVIDAFQDVSQLTLNKKELIDMLNSIQEDIRCQNFKIYFAEHLGNWMCFVFPLNDISEGYEKYPYDPVLELKFLMEDWCGKESNKSLSDNTSDILGTYCIVNFKDPSKNYSPRIITELAFEKDLPYFRPENMIRTKNTSSVPNAANSEANDAFCKGCTSWTMKHGHIPHYMPQPKK